MNADSFSKRFPFLLTAVFGLFTGGAGATEPPVAAVLRADAVRLQAMMAGDSIALGQVLSDAVLFVHSDARVESKADYTKNLTSGGTAYADAKTSEVLSRQVSPDVVVLAGVQTMRKKLGTEWSEVKLRFLSVWRNENGEWRMVAWQSARPAGNSVVLQADIPNVKTQTPKKSQ